MAGWRGVDAGTERKQPAVLVMLWQAQYRSATYDDRYLRQMVMKCCCAVPLKRIFAYAQSCDIEMQYGSRIRGSRHSVV
ncbi:hypothetical protein KCP73_24145 [Salmonella enterica subsp. enterica]|nr:hypothetical protein KCP73_24145 [Salmonella enterica subsp. enterica]